MKESIFVFLIFLTTQSYSQNVINDLQGRWICDKIVDSANFETNGKFGQSSDYLQFYFRKKTLSIIKAPFDRDIAINFDFSKRDSIIDLFPNLRPDFFLPESKYKIVSLSHNQLILRTKSEKNKTVSYYLTNQAEFLKNIKDSIFIDYDTIVITHLRYSEKATNRASQYIISRNPSLYLPCPTYEDNISAQFGFYLSIKFKFPAYINVGSITNDMIVEFDVTKKGAENINIIKGLANEFDSQILNEIYKTRKKWKPVMVNDKIIISRNRFHILFYLAKAEPFTFKDSK